ncbi:unnamed protein product [Didymodactylos carnosus]|uniref:Uncharacterized protein n=1 Tax=Didymodactylos carnosus TaxID=1234261 RepID=A0A815E9W6_9BILA|nr:unnamed protein product [Didymodactylos carnosus]CAF4144275.1 unnamed protein product [Didymodactylos carnosus]
MPISQINYQNYSVKLQLDSTFLIITVENEQSKFYIKIDNKQCTVVTNGLCETSEQLYELLHDLLNKNEHQKLYLFLIHKKLIELHVDFTIFFGNTVQRKWSFVIHLNQQNGDAAESTKTLDPTDWVQTRVLGHRMMDDMLSYLQNIRSRPPWQPMPQNVKDYFKQDLPYDEKCAFDVYDDFKTNILPYPVGNIHPRFFGYVQGAGTVIGALSGLLTATMNTMSWGGEQASIYAEKQVLQWLKTLMGFPQESSGVLVSGTSIATLIAFTLVRKKYTPAEFAETGFSQLNNPLRIYCSSEAHNCLIRAAQILGIGTRNVVIIPANQNHQIDLEKLEQAIRSDKEAGAIPMCVLGTAGTVGTGSIDDLNGIADLCEKYSLWFHVDGAIGAVARCSKRLAPLVAGMERADSLAFDLHKLFSIPYEAGCILIRDAALHTATFANPATYLTLLDGGVTPAHETFFNDYGIELSRDTKAIKVWMSLKGYGIERFARVIEQSVDHAQYFASKVRECDQLELITTGSFQIVCFRFVLPNKTVNILNKLNKRLLVAIQERGIAVPSPYTVEDKFALRVCITNHRTTREDLDYFLENLLIVGNELGAHM